MESTQHSKGWERCDRLTIREIKGINRQISQLRSKVIRLEAEATKTTQTISDMPGTANVSDKVGTITSQIADINRNDLYITLRIGTDGTEYFAVKQGLLLQGIVLPYDVVNENFVDKLNELYRLSDMALNNQKSKSVKSDT